MNAIETIHHKEKQIALIIRADYFTNDVQFFSKPHDFFQLGFFYRKKGYHVPAHYHSPKDKIYLSELSECIQVKRGKIKVRYFSDELSLIAEITLQTGDTILHTTVIHEVEFIQDSLILELKQGPYDPHSKHIIQQRMTL